VGVVKVRGVIYIRIFWFTRVRRMPIPRLCSSHSCHTKQQNLHPWASEHESAFARFGLRRINKMPKTTSFFAIWEISTLENINYQQPCYTAKFICLLNKNVTLCNIFHSSAEDAHPTPSLMLQTKKYPCCKPKLIILVEKIILPPNAWDSSNMIFFACFSHDVQ